jgi:hypothetical protein
MIVADTAGIIRVMQVCREGSVSGWYTFSPRSYLSIILHDILRILSNAVTADAACIIRIMQVSG